MALSNSLFHEVQYRSSGFLPMILSENEIAFKHGLVET